MQYLEIIVFYYNILSDVADKSYRLALEKAYKNLQRLDLGLNYSAFLVEKMRM